MSNKKDFLNSLFRDPVPYEPQKVRKTEVLIVDSDDSGASVVHSVFVEDVMFRQVDLNYGDVTLSNLVAKGVEPHALDMIDSSKLGVDEGVDRLAQHIVDHSSDYVVLSKS